MSRRKAASYTEAETQLLEKYAAWKKLEQRMDVKRQARQQSTVGSADGGLARSRSSSLSRSASGVLGGGAAHQHGSSEDAAVAIAKAAELLAQAKDKQQDSRDRSGFKRRKRAAKPVDVRGSTQTRTNETNPSSSTGQERVTMWRPDQDGTSDVMDTSADNPEPPSPQSRRRSTEGSSAAAAASVTETHTEPQHHLQNAASAEQTELSASPSSPTSKLQRTPGDETGPTTPPGSPPESTNPDVDAVYGPPVQQKTNYEFVMARSATVYVGGLHTPLPDGLLHDSFAQFGNIVDIRIAGNGTFVFIQYESPDEAAEAVRLMRGVQLGDNILRVYKAQPKDT